VGQQSGCDVARAALIKQGGLVVHHIGDAERELKMMGSKSYRPKLCSCGSGKPADPQFYNGEIVSFACKNCTNARMAVYNPDMLTNKN
jgi:hypothetical protein